MSAGEPSNRYCGANTCDFAIIDHIRFFKVKAVGKVCHLIEDQNVIYSASLHQKGVSDYLVRSSAIHNLATCIYSKELRKEEGSLPEHHVILY